MYNLSISDHFGEWRQTAAKNLATKVQKRFHELQNPSDCSAAKKIICNLNKACGYGCQIHHLMYCFTISFFTNRTMILDSNNWRYNSQGFGAYFQSISQTCAKNTNYQTYADWNGKDLEVGVVIVAMIAVTHANNVLNYILILKIFT